MKDKIYFCPFVLLVGPWSYLEEQIRYNIGLSKTSEELKKRLQNILDKETYKKEYYLIHSKETNQNKDNFTWVIIEGVLFPLKSETGIVLPKWELDNIEMHLEKARSKNYQEPVVKKSDDCADWQEAFEDYRKEQNNADS